MRRRKTTSGENSQIVWEFRGTYSFGQNKTPSYKLTMRTDNRKVK